MFYLGVIVKNMVVVFFWKSRWVVLKFNLENVIKVCYIFVLLLIFLMIW